MTLASKSIEPEITVDCATYHGGPHSCCETQLIVVVNTYSVLKYKMLAFFETCVSTRLLVRDLLKSIQINTATYSISFDDSN